MYTIALIPNKTVSKQIVAFTEKYSEYITGNKLNMRCNVPHVTLLKTAFKAETDLKKLLNDITSEYKNTSSSGVLLGLTIGSGRNYIASMAHDSSIVDLHNIVLPIVKPLVNKAGIKNKKFVGPTVEEVESYFKYGYKYTGDKFFSHISFGRASADEVPYEMLKEYEEIFLGKEIIFEKIVICRGVKDMIGQVIVSKRLKPKSIPFIS